VRRTIGPWRGHKHAVSNSAGTMPGVFRRGLPLSTSLADLR
jgi:hypothetical protein